MFYEPLRAASDQECYMHLRKHAHKCGAATESGAGGFAARGVNARRLPPTRGPAAAGQRGTPKVKISKPRYYVLNFTYYYGLDSLYETRERYTLCTAPL